MSILFQSDWTNENGKLRAIPHTTTKNTSFLRTCALFKKMNIKNYAFPLALYDPDLKDVDVHDLEENSPENEIIRTKVQIEARRNVWYFLRECVRVDAAGGSPVKFRLDRAAAAMTWCFLNGIDYAATQPRQTGKEQPLYTLIKTPTGWTSMGNIKIGDTVSTPDGKSASVVGVYPQGVKDIYRVYFEDGRWTDCGEEHLWKVYHSHWAPANDRWRVVKLEDIINYRKLHPNSESGFSVPLIEPEELEDTDLPLDPYLVGALIGDGGMTNGAKFSSQDEFILEEVERLLPDGVELIHAAGIDYRIIDRNRTPAGRVSPFLETIRKLELNKYSYEKTIPPEYMNASPNQRQALLQGLMDTDGTVDKSSSSSFCTTSLKLAHQVQELVRSLGGICKLKEKRSFYTHNGEYKQGRLSYILRIRIKDPKNLFRLPRKKDRVTDNYKSANTLNLRIIAIEFVGQHEAQCIEVDHPDHLYIADDYIVTHNTVCAATLCGWMIYISGSKFQIGSMTKDSSLREENVKRVKAVGENLPNWWMAENKFKDKKNTEEIYYSELDNHFITYVANADPRKADLQARGASPPAFWFDEFEFIINVAISYPTILASTGTARENARLNGKPHSNIITTTAGDPKKKECREAAAILDGAMAFTELLYDLENRDKLHEVVQASSPQKMVLGVFSHLQLGYDNAWLREKIARNRMTRDQTMRDYLNRRVSIQEKPIIPEHTLALINASQMDPKYIQILNGKYVIYWYISEEEVKSQAFRERSIVVGCDSSEMIDRDATTLVGIDPRDASVVFTWRCNEGNINTVGMMMAQLLMMYPKMVLVPENKSSGTSLIDIISLLLRREGHNPFKRIFNWVVDRQKEQEFSKYDIRDVSLLDTAVKKYFGIKTDKSKRDELYSNTLLAAANKAANKIRDKTLISELGSLTVRNGRVDHEVGGTDDMVIAFLMAFWFILNAKHLDVYGIKPGTVMSFVNPGNSDKNRLTQEHQKAVRDKIEELEDQLKNQRDPVLRKLIESDLVVLNAMVKNAPVSSPETADDLMRDPRKFIDRDIADQSRPNINPEDVEKSLRSIMGLR